MQILARLVYREGRLRPIGTDRNGCRYFFFADDDRRRVFAEEKAEGSCSVVYDTEEVGWSLKEAS